MKTDTLILLVAVGAVAYFAFGRHAQAQAPTATTVVVEREEEGLIETGGRFLDRLIDSYWPDD